MYRVLFGSSVEPYAILLYVQILGKPLETDMGKTVEYKCMETVKISCFLSWCFSVSYIKDESITPQ